jgi:DNA repair protein RadC
MRLDSSRKVFSILQQKMSKDAEEFWALALNSELLLIDLKLLFRGTVDSCPIHARDLVRFICTQNASSFIIAHNHPSGNPRPSAEDSQITKKIFQISELIEIKLNDHLIVSTDSYFSFADSGQLQKMRSEKLLSLATQRLRKIQ